MCNVHESYRRLGIISSIIGPEGAYFCELGGLQNVFCKGLFWAYYNDNKVIKLDTIQKYIRGTAPFPSKIKQYYIGKDGELLLRQGIEQLVNACMCMDRLRIMQDTVATYITCSAIADPPMAKKLSSYYISNNATREQIVVYLTTVMTLFINT